jgi:hypothetical protein
MEGIHEADAPCPAEAATDCGQASADGLAEPGRRAAEPGRQAAEPGAAESGRRVVEQRTYRALVDRAYETARGPTAQDGWAEAVPALRASWEILKERYGHEERAEPAPQADGGSWRGKGGRVLDATTNAEIELGYARIREVGENVIVPAILRVAAEDPTRTLAGFDCRIKGLDRLKEKVSALLEPPTKLTAGEALSAIVDVVRFTYMYHENRYTQGVVTDVERLKSQGFELDRLKNTWTSEQYKGINTQWLEPHSGVRFEVQFHTQASLEAKELTHEAYERMRSITERTPETEREAEELEAFQSEANAQVPIPPGARVIEDYRREKLGG